jgi:hypothetical protein
MRSSSTRPLGTEGSGPALELPPVPEALSPSFVVQRGCRRDGVADAKGPE